MMAEEIKSEKAYRILVVDDDEEILNLIKLTLERSDDMDVEIVTETKPKMGLDLLKKENFDVILSDQRMEGMNGLELLSYVKEKYPHIARVLITAYSELELAKDAINKAKVDLYIEKPWTKSQIRTDIKGLLDNKRVKTEVDMKIEDGNSYLILEKEPDSLFQLGLKRMKEKGEGLVISRLNPKKAAQLFDMDKLKIDFYWLSKMMGDKILDPVDLELIADMIIRYYENGGKTVILEGMDALLRDNSFKRFEGFIDNIVDVVSIEEGVFLTGLDPMIIPGDKLATIEKKMKAMNIEER